MFLTKKHLSRRHVLRGAAGVAISLPLLDAMIPAGTALAGTPANIKPRLAYVSFPHGAGQKFWTPEGAGKDFQFSRILKPLEGMRDYDLGGILISYSTARHTGSSFVEMSIVSSTGKLIR